MKKNSKNQKIANKILTTHLFPSNQIFCFPINKFKYNGKISKIALNYLYYKIYKYQIFLGYIIFKSKFISGAIHFLLQNEKLLGDDSNLKLKYNGHLIDGFHFFYEKGSL